MRAKLWSLFPSVLALSSIPAFMRRKGEHVDVSIIWMVVVGGGLAVVVTRPGLSLNGGRVTKSSDLMRSQKLVASPLPLVTEGWQRPMSALLYCLAVLRSTGLHSHTSIFNMACKERSIFTIYTK
jgi:hypothetical protein